MTFVHYKSDIISVSRVERNGSDLRNDLPLLKFKKEETSGLSFQYKSGMVNKNKSIQKTPLNMKKSVRSDKFKVESKLIDIDVKSTQVIVLNISNNN